MRQRLQTLLAMLVVLLLLLPATAVAACRGSHERPSQTGQLRQSRAAACLINAKRRKRGLARLRTDARLASAAGNHVNDMVRRGFFDHVSPDGATLVDRIRATGYLSGARAWEVAEDIAWGAGRGSTPAAIVRSWMRSPPHRAAILDASFRHLGIGIALGSPGQPGATVTFTATFGTRG